MGELPRIAAADEVAHADNRVMTKPREEPDLEERSSKPTRLDEARRVIEEYANDLREIIRRVRHPLQ
jgi:hypothetical protein